MKVTNLTGVSPRDVFNRGPYGKKHQQERNRWPRDGETWEQFYARTAKAKPAHPPHNLQTLET